MRGLMRAVRWFLAPALATAVIAADGLARAGTTSSDPAALIQLGLPDVDSNTYRDASLLRLDVLESAEPCGYGNVTLNDQTLDQDGHGRGSGSLVLGEGSTFVARWNFTCVEVGASEEPEQLMEVAVDLVDGTAVAGLNFAVRFKQTTPIQVLSVDGLPSVVTAPRPAGGSRAADDQLVEPEASELQRLKAELEQLTRQKLALEKAILDKQFSAGAKTDECHVKASTKMRKCHSPRCLVSTMYHKIKDAAGIRSRLSCSTEDADESPIRIAFPDKDKERPLVAISDEILPQAHMQYDSQQQSSHRGALSKWRRIEVFLLFLPAGVMVVVLLVVFGVKHAKSPAPEDAEKQARHRERRAARREAQEGRRAALQARFEELKRRFRERLALRSTSVEDEEKDAMVRPIQAGGGGDDSGSESDSDASTTMEQELASFRNIADVVGSMVSSAAGVPRPPSPKYHHHQQPPRRPGYAFSDCGSVDEELPSYDEGVIGASHVADGFRYAPGGRSPLPGHQTAPLASPLDDVLGKTD